MSAPARIVDVPVALPWDRGGEPDVPMLGRELRLLWLIEEVRQRRLGAGKGSELAGLPRAAFMRILGEHGVPVIDYSVDDLDGELGGPPMVAEPRAGWRRTAPPAHDDPVQIVERIRDLLDDGRLREARALANEHGPNAGPYARLLEPPRAARSAPPGRPDFVRNMKWVDDHRPEYLGKWVALRDGDLIACADKLRVLQMALGKSGETDVLVVQVSA